LHWQLVVRQRLDEERPQLGGLGAVAQRAQPEAAQGERAQLGARRGERGKEGCVCVQVHLVAPYGTAPGRFTEASRVCVQARFRALG